MKSQSETAARIEPWTSTATTMAAFARALVIILVSMAAAGRGMVAQQTDGNVDCTDSIVSLSPCLSYMMGSSNPSIPRDDCCDALAAVITSHAPCLCELVSTDDFLGFPINQTLALALPSICNLLNPHDLDQCVVVLPPSSDAPVLQPVSDAPPPLFEAPSPFDGVLPSPPMESLPPSIDVPDQDAPQDMPFPNASAAGALFAPFSSRLIWGSILIAILI